MLLTALFVYFLLFLLCVVFSFLFLCYCSLVFFSTLGPGRLDFLRISSANGLARPSWQAPELRHLKDSWLFSQKSQLTPWPPASPASSSVSWLSGPCHFIFVVTCFTHVLFVCYYFFCFCLLLFICFFDTRPWETWFLKDVLRKWACTAILTSSGAQIP